MTPQAPGQEKGAHKARRPFVIFAPFILFAALAALFLVRLFSGDSSLLPSALIGKKVPEFVLPAVEGLEGKPGFTAADLQQGNVTLINVFASWCVPCREEHETIMRLAADPILANSGVRLFGLAYKDAPREVRGFLSANGDPFARIGADRSGRIAIDFGVYGVPETFVIKGDGTIAYRFVGPMSEESYRATILPEIAKALK